MKKILLALLLGIASLAAQAQFSPGQVGTSAGDFIELYQE